MVVWTYKEAINDWINYIDSEIFPKFQFLIEEPWHNTKTIILDSIEVMDFMRKFDSDIPMSTDNRLQNLLDICVSGCRHDYFDRFKQYRPEVYHGSENLWWIDCWESIRLNNILHELDVRHIDGFFTESLSGGGEFKKKWELFFRIAKSRKDDVNSLPAFSYLECVRFCVNLDREIQVAEFMSFLNKLCEIDEGRLKYYPKSLEIRIKALSIIEKIKNKKSDESEFDNIYASLTNIAIEMISSCNWNKFAHSLACALFELHNKEIRELIITKLKNEVTIESSWVNGLNFMRKPRYSLLLSINELKNYKYFELVKPNCFVYTPSNYSAHYKNISCIIDNIVQSFYTNTDLQKKVQDLQKKVQDDDIKENIKKSYFRDLLKTGLSGSIGNSIRYVE